MPADISVCIAQAATLYRADSAQVLALVVGRGGRSGEIRRLANGEVEIGITRIPGNEARKLRSNGITEQMLADDDCLNITIATYLSQRAAINGRAAVSASNSFTTMERTLAKEQGQYCLKTAALRYTIPVDVMRAVLVTEGGWSGLKKRNRNGSHDLGWAQINTIHLKELSRYGVTEQQLASDVCVNFHVAAYRLRYEINRAGEFWRGVGNYHSRTPALSLNYVNRVKKNIVLQQETTR